MLGIRQYVDEHMLEPSNLAVYRETVTQVESWLTATQSGVVRHREVDVHQLHDRLEEALCRPRTMRYGGVR